MTAEGPCDKCHELDGRLGETGQAIEQLVLEYARSLLSVIVPIIGKFVALFRASFLLTYPRSIRYYLLRNRLTESLPQLLGRLLRSHAAALPLHQPSHEAVMGS